MSAASLPGASISGHISGVVSLTDLLNLFAHVSGLSPVDPDETRRRRRRSSSSSVRKSVDGLRSSIDIGRGGVDAVRGSVDLGRSGSQRK